MPFGHGQQRLDTRYQKMVWNWRDDNIKDDCFSQDMGGGIERLEKNSKGIRMDPDKSKVFLKGQYGLSDCAKKGLKEARETPESEYTDLE